MKSLHAKVVLAGYKSKGSDWDCQDAYAYVEDSETSRMAVADGVTNASFMSKEFAQRLVDTFVTMPVFAVHGEPAPTEVQLRSSPLRIETRVLDDRAVPEFAARVKQRWRESVARVYLPAAFEHQRSCWTKGELASYATFAGVQCKRKDDGSQLVTIVVVGDCYVFVGREDESLGVVTGSEGGDSLTHAISVGVDDRRKFLGKLHVAHIQVAAPSCILMTTDYLGRQICRDLAPDTPIWPAHLKSLLRLRRQSDLSLWISERGKDPAAGPVDDAAVMLVRLDSQPRRLPEVPRRRRDLATEVIAAEAVQADAAPAATSETELAPVTSNVRPKPSAQVEPESTRTSTSNVNPFRFSRRWGWRKKKNVYEGNTAVASPVDKQESVVPALPRGAAGPESIDTRHPGGAPLVSEGVRIRRRHFARLFGGNLPVILLIGALAWFMAQQNALLRDIQAVLENSTGRPSPPQSVTRTGTPSGTSVSPAAPVSPVTVAPIPEAPQPIVDATEEARARLYACVQAMIAKAPSQNIIVTPRQVDNASNLTDFNAQLLWVDLYIAFKTPLNRVDMAISETFLDALKSDPLYPVLSTVAGLKGNDETLKELAGVSCPASR